jgi:hypothetical protein
MHLKYFWQKRLLAVLLAIGVALAIATASYAQSPLGTTTQPPPLVNRIRQYEPVYRPGATAYMLWTSGGQPHQVWFRVLGGDALYEQRLDVYKENAGPRFDNILPPISTLVHSLLGNRPTGWYNLGSEIGTFSYYIDGDHRKAPNAPWEDNEGVRMRQTSYENGELFDISFEDIVDLDDYNDLEVEVVIITN